jgi:HD-like signal output (HDOD) protein/CheY-like chemotaxis protein
MSNPRILFVDDETMLLMGLQRGLRRMRAEWEMEFVSSSAAALEAMARLPFDVIVTDMCMPEMSGAELLEHVGTQYPQTLRFILSGQCDRKSTLRTVNSAHQYLAKPCDLEELRQKLMSALALRNLVESTTLKEVILRIKTLPAMPSLYRELVNKLESPLCSTKDVGEIIEHDMALTSKVLQMVNSAFFGLGRHVASPTYALSLLGTEIVKSLVLTLELFSQLHADGFPRGRGDWLLNHSIATSRMSRRVAQLGAGDRALMDDCSTAGLLHDLGELILASELSSEYKTIVKVADAENISTQDAELKVLGCGHAELGAYLLGIWGLPVNVVEAVAWHHHPSVSPVSKPCPLVAVHIAACASTGLDPYRPQDCFEIDHAFLDRCGLKEKEVELIDACKSLLPNIDQ